MTLTSCRACCASLAASRAWRVDSSIERLATRLSCAAFSSRTRTCCLCSCSRACANKQPIKYRTDSTAPAQTNNQSNAAKQSFNQTLKDSSVRQNKRPITCTTADQTGAPSTTIETCSLQCDQSVSKDWLLTNFGIEFLSFISPCFSHTAFFHDAPQLLQ